MKGFVGILLLLLVSVSYANAEEHTLVSSRSSAVSDPRDSADDIYTTQFGAADDRLFTLTYVNLKVQELTSDDLPGQILPSENYRVFFPSIHIACEDSFREVMLVIEVPNHPTSITDKVARTRVFRYTNKKHNDVIKVSHTDFSYTDSTKRVINGESGNLIKITVKYLSWDSSSYQVAGVFWMSIENTENPDEPDRDVVVRYTNEDKTFATYASEGSPDEGNFGEYDPVEGGSFGGEEPTHKIGRSTILSIIVSIWAGMFFIQFGIGLFIKFQSAGAEFGAIIVIILGFMFIASAIGMIVGVFETILDALEILSKPAGWAADAAGWVGDKVKFW
jgi:hypothetical protein